MKNKPIIKVFDPEKEVMLTTDTCEKAIAAILSQEEHPIMYISRRLMSAETNDSNIEKEALAIVWSMERAQNLLIGKNSY